jgi:hypothetical protein
MKAAELVALLQGRGAAITVGGTLGWWSALVNGHRLNWRVGYGTAHSVRHAAPGLLSRPVAPAQLPEVLREILYADPEGKP